MTCALHLYPTSGGRMRARYVVALDHLTRTSSSRRETAECVEDSPTTRRRCRGLAVANGGQEKGHASGYRPSNCTTLRRHDTDERTGSARPEQADSGLPGRRARLPDSGQECVQLKAA